LLVRELPDGRLMIIDGHLRAETTPDSLVPVLVLDVTEEEADKILLTLDPLAAMAESDAERIEALLTTVRTDSEAVQELLKRIAGPKLWEILHPEDVEEAAVALDHADELRVQWGTAPGQLWQIGPHRIICGDCTNLDVVARQRRCVRFAQPGRHLTRAIAANGSDPTRSSTTRSRASRMMRPSANSPTSCTKSIRMAA
jgi:hypothetical protein